MSTPNKNEITFNLPTINSTSHMKELDPSERQRMDKAWQLIQTNFRSMVVECAKKNGPGISVFRFLPKPRENNSNCEFYYFEKDGDAWKTLENVCPTLLALQVTYNPEKHFIVNINIPTKTGVEDANTIGEIRMFEFDV